MRIGSIVQVAQRGGVMDRFVLYAVKLMQPIVEEPYSMVYYHANCNEKHTPGLSFMRELHAALGSKHKDNLKVLYIVHPTLSLRATLWTLTLLKFGVSHRVFSKSVSIDQLEHLYRCLPKEQLAVPEFVEAHDAELLAKK